MTVSLRLVLLAAIACSGCGSDDSPLLPAGEPQPEPLPPEAGFLEVPVLPGKPRSVGRLFYAFQSADYPDDAPILVFFNGGPGIATTSVLMAFGTGPFTLAPTPTDDPPHANPHSYTSFGNLLYLDARQTGFSYDVDPSPGDPSSRVCDRLSTEQSYVTDAAEMIFAVLDFLDARETLRDNPVVLVGESYGGTRSAVMLSLLQHHADPGLAPVPPIQNVDGLAPGLRERIASHFALAFPERQTTPEAVALQFGWQALIQPGFADAEYILNAQEPLISMDPDFQGLPADAYDYDVRTTHDAATAILDRTRRSLRDPAALELLLGLDLAQIEGLASSERGTAFRNFAVSDSGDPATLRAFEERLSSRLGELGPDDAYFLHWCLPCDQFLGDTHTLGAFGDVLSRTKTFITNARWDRVVYTKALPAMLGLELDSFLPEGAARPGVLRGNGVQIRFPTYEAGHMVTMSAAAELKQDVEAWLEAEGAIGRGRSSPRTSAR